MTSRLHLLSSVVMLIACRMDNPAFDGSTDDVADVGDGTGDTIDSGETGESTGTGTSTSTDENDSVDVDTSVDTTDATSSTTGPDCAPGTECGTCHVCDNFGECVPKPGAECDEAVTYCADYLWGSQGSWCYLLAANELPGTCDDLGQCKHTSPQFCPFEQGETHFQCDLGCVTNPQGCAPLAAADDVGVSAMCATQGQTNACHPVCVNSAVAIYNCTEGGLCANLGQDLCNPFACDALFNECLMFCEGELDCAEGFVCSNGDCVLP